jgi:hypothetical protein
MKIDVQKWGIKTIEDKTLKGTTVEINKYLAEPFVEYAKSQHKLEARIVDNDDCDDGYVLVIFQ